MERAEALLLEALELSAKERAGMAADLLASLDDAPVATAEEVEMSWGTEIERRAHRALARDSQGIPWERVQQELRDRLAKR